MNCLRWFVISFVLAIIRHSFLDCCRVAQVGARTAHLDHRHTLPSGCNTMVGSRWQYKAHSPSTNWSYVTLAILAMSSRFDFAPRALARRTNI